MEAYKIYEEDETKSFSVFNVLRRCSIYQEHFKELIN